MATHAQRMRRTPNEQPPPRGPTSCSRHAASRPAPGPRTTTRRGVGLGQSRPEVRRSLNKRWSPVHVARPPGPGSHLPPAPLTPCAGEGGDGRAGRAADATSLNYTWSGRQFRLKFIICQGHVASIRLGATRTRARALSLCLSRPSLTRRRVLSAKNLCVCVYLSLSHTHTR